MSDENLDAVVEEAIDAAEEVLDDADLDDDNYEKAAKQVIAGLKESLEEWKSEGDDEDEGEDDDEGEAEGEAEGEEEAGEPE